MADTHLLLPGTKTPVPVHTHKHPKHWSYRLILIIGVIAILAGAADVLARFSYTVLGECAPTAAFGPAISALDPSLAQPQKGNTDCK